MIKDYKKQKNLLSVCSHGCKALLSSATAASLAPNSCDLHFISNASHLYF